ncbi:hypothetical protein BD410DRAFT_119482 [Rickenella mellea]|uniref:Uncharacterized protein n=1 Tax=Rickenella mellea TaxID=50990 RepID=A0A4Y7QAJ2_9AGAM|nr:hypothetical protein BD410DRAFT_119482 [Rickenella mellea]
MSTDSTQLIVFVQDLQTVRMLTLSSLVVLLYDIALSFSDEVQALSPDITRYSVKTENSNSWITSGSPNGPVARGYTWLVDTLLRAFAFSGQCIIWALIAQCSICAGMTYAELWGSWLIGVPIQVVLTLRTLAVWQRSHIVAGILVLVASIYFITMIVCSVILTKSNHYIPSPLMGPLQLCYSSNDGVSPNITKYAFGSLMLYDGVMFFLILVKAVLDDRRTRTKLLGILLRDGAIYYAALFALTIANILFATVVLQHRLVLALSLSTTLFVAQSIGASHIILSIRKYTHQRQVVRTLHISDIQFSDKRSVVDELTGQMGADVDDERE